VQTVKTRYWSTEDQSFIAEIPELPGCMSDATTYREALKSAETVIGEWIETARELGRPIPGPKGRLVHAWATTIARICRDTGERSPQVAGLRDAYRGSPMRVLAVVTELPEVRRIFLHLIETGVVPPRAEESFPN
jgi:predicted RNase H-like HicB family nuclease